MSSQKKAKRSVQWGSVPCDSLTLLTADHGCHKDCNIEIKLVGKLRGALFVLSASLEDDLSMCKRTK